jgi:hypothetical protein
MEVGGHFVNGYFTILKKLHIALDVNGIDRASPHALWSITPLFQ